MPIILIALCAALALAVDAPKPPQRPTGVDDKLWDQLLAIDRRSSTIADLTADFTQSKFTALLKEPLVSRGRVTVKGSVTRWDTFKPHATTMRISPRDVRIFYPEQKLLEIYRVGDRLADLAASPLPRLSVLVRYFHVEAKTATDPNTLALHLTPIDDTLKQHVDHVDVEVETRTACMKKMEMVDADGERTVAEFGETKTNSGVTDEQMELKVPAGTRVSRPLEAAEQ